MILGLSHVFGETLDFDATVEFWLARGWRSAMKLDLPVPTAKRALLRRKDATNVRLQYLERVGSPAAPGLEFIHHTPGVSASTSAPPLRLRIRSTRDVDHKDPSGNDLKEAVTLERTIVEITVADIQSARLRLLELGFAPQNSDGEVLTLSPRLMPHRAFSIALRDGGERSAEPFVDDVGWSGLSLLVRDLDQVSSRLPLIARQTFSASGNDRREVGFFCDGGLLIEFLAIRRFDTPHSSGGLV